MLTRENRPLLLLSLALVVATLAVYWQVGGHEFVNYDDNRYIAGNPHVATGLTAANVAWAFTAIHMANWHPLTWLSHMLDVQLFGLDPRGHHLVNVLFHAANTLLLFWLLVRLTACRWRSAFVAALFALHPLHVESVAWVAERKDVLSAFFWFATLHFYASYVGSRRPASYLLALGAFVLGLMSKPMLVSLPVVLLLLDFWPLGRFAAPESGRPGPFAPLVPLLREKIPFIACSFLSCVMTVFAQNRGGAMSSLDALPFGIRLANAITSYGEYLLKGFWPTDLAVFYPFPESMPTWQLASSALLLISLSVLAVQERQRHPFLATGWLWFLVTLLPVIGLVQVGEQSMADRYTYIPMVGILMAVAWGAPALLAGWRHGRTVLALAAGAVVIISTAVTWRQIGYWRDSITLFRHAVEVTEGNYIMHTNLGYALAGKGEYEAAIVQYREALRIKPRLSEVHNDLGLVYSRVFDLDAAIGEYRQALELNPAYPEALTNLGNAHARKGDPLTAIDHYKRALAIDPTYALAHKNMQVALQQLRMGAGATPAGGFPRADR